MVTSPLADMSTVYDSSTLPVVGFAMPAGSEAFCWSVIDLMYVESSPKSGSKSEKRGWNFHGTKFLLNLAS